MIEDSSSAAFWGGYFYLQTVAAITGEFLGHLWEHAHQLADKQLIGLEGAVVQPYRQPPPLLRAECLAIEDNGWIAKAYLPVDRAMPREWRLEVTDPAGKAAYSFLAGLALWHEWMFGPDSEDVTPAEAELQRLISEARIRRGEEP